MAETMHVRLKAHNPKKGHVLQRYTVGGIRFQAGRGWYKVDANVAAYLETVHQIPDDEDSPLAFDVCTEAEAHAIDEREARAARQVLPAEEAMDVTRRRRMRVADVTRSRRDALRRVRAEPPPRVRREERAEPPRQEDAPPRVRREERAEPPRQEDAPPRHQDDLGHEEESEGGPHEAQTAGDEPAGEQPEDAADPWEESADLARDLLAKGAAEESFDDGLPADPEVPPEDAAAEAAEAAETAEDAEGSSSALTTEDLPDAHGRRPRRRKRR